MGTWIIKLAAAALAVSFLAWPEDLSAQEERGADLVVTRLDGSRISGEIIAVRPDSLLLLGPGSLDIAVGLAEIRSVRVVRKPPTLLLTAAGFLLGSGVTGIATEPLDEWGWAHAMLAGIGGAVAGLATGLVSGADKEFSIAAEPEDAAGPRLERLERISREGRLRGGDRKARRPHFRIGLATTMGSFNDSWEGLRTDSSWRFTGAVPPQESGPRVASFWLSRNTARELASAGPVSFGFEWAERWTAEIELSAWNRDLEVGLDVLPSFVSTADGRTYTVYGYYRSRESFASLLLGLSYRPVVPSSGRGASLELGVAAGPARFKIGPYGSLLPAARKTVPAARAHLAYDYRFHRGLSLGVYIGYRHSEAGFPASTVTQDMMFTTWPDPAEPIVRQVEMTVPSRTFSRSGFIYGLRLHFRL